MIVNPLSLAPADMPAIVVEVAAALAFPIFPAFFVLVCLAMCWTQIQRPPYFTYLCAFAALGCLSLSVATANSPLSALAALVAYIVCPILSTVNFLRLRPFRSLSLWHRGAQWAALLSTAIVLLLVIWAAFDPNTPPKPA